MNDTKKILSVQDISCYGQCSNTVMLPVLSAGGLEMTAAGEEFLPGPREAAK